MYIKPEIAFRPFKGASLVYKCQCKHHFKRLDLLFQKPINGTRNYCPNCKIKFIFEGDE